MDENQISFQNIILENREKLTITGVVDVYNFDDQIVIIETTLGLLTIKGQNLKITKLSIEQEDFEIQGYISNLNYSNQEDFSKKGKSLLNKIFK